MGTTSEKLVYLNETKQKIKESINLTNANIVDEPFRQYAVILKNRLPEIVGDPSIIWNNYEHVTGSGTSITISTYKSIFEYSLNGDTTQSGTPTPDAPIPVNTVTGNQTITISDGTNSSVKYINLGKNLINYNDFTSQATITVTDETINVTNNTASATGGLSLILTNKLQSGTYTFKNYADSNGTIYVMLSSNDYTHLITVNSSFTFQYDGSSYLRLLSPNISAGDSKTFKLQLEKGSTATSYASYFTPIELCKIGTYQDRIYKSNGKWYLHKEIGKVTYNGSESGWGYDTTNYFFVMAFTGYLVSGINIPYCNYYKGRIPVTAGANVQNNEIALSSDNTKLRIYVKNTSITSLADFKTWLGIHNLNVYYVLATATTEEIKNYNLLNDLNSLELMNGNINITVSGDLPSPIDITAIKN